MEVKELQTGGYIHHKPLSGYVLDRSAVTVVIVR